MGATMAAGAGEIYDDSRVTRKLPRPASSRSDAKAIRRKNTAPGRKQAPGFLPLVLHDAIRHPAVKTERRLRSRFRSHSELLHKLRDFGHCRHFGAATGAHIEMVVKSPRRNPAQMPFEFVHNDVVQHVPVPQKL